MISENTNGFLILPNTMLPLLSMSGASLSPGWYIGANMIFGEVGDCYAVPLANKDSKKSKRVG